jgi:hypothetical protein
MESNYDPIYEIMSVIEDLCNDAMRVAQYPKRKKKVGNYIKRLQTAVEKSKTPLKYYPIWSKAESIMKATVLKDSQIDGFNFIIPIKPVYCKNKSFYDFSERFKEPVKENQDEKLF